MAQRKNLPFHHIRPLLRTVYDTELIRRIKPLLDCLRSVQAHWKPLVPVNWAKAVTPCPVTIQPSVQFDWVMIMWLCFLGPGTVGGGGLQHGCTCQRMETKVDITQQFVECLLEILVVNSIQNQMAKMDWMWIPEDNWSMLGQDAKKNLLVQYLKVWDIKIRQLSAAHWRNKRA